MSGAALSLPAVQRPLLAVALAGAAGLAVYLLEMSAKQAGLFVVGLGLGVALYHASFGLSGAYRRAIVDKDISGVSAQLAMLAAAMMLFAPILAQGSAFGHGVVGAVAPVGVAMVLGAFIFGIGMQLAGGCASGTLYSAGGGNLRTALVLVFFCAGAFWGSLDLAWWNGLPGLEAVSLSGALGWEVTVPLQLGALALIYVGLRLAGGRNRRPLWWDDGFSWRNLLRGPWPLLHR